MRARHVILVSLIAGCGSDTPPPSPPPPACVATLGHGADDLLLDGTGGCVTHLDLALRVATGDPAAPVWSPTGGLTIGGSWTASDLGFARTLTVTNSTSAPVSLVGLEWSSTSFTSSPPVDRLLHNGYQSWSYTGVQAIPATLTDRNGTAPHGGDSEDLIGEVVGVSWWWTAISDGSGQGLVLGADGGTVLKTYVAVDAGRVRIVMGVTGDALTLAPGETRALDGLYVFVGALGDGLDAYAAHVATLRVPATPRSPPRGGWGSWNVYYAMPMLSDLRQDLAWAHATLLPLGLDDFLLDDGYEPHWGDWQASPAFGASLTDWNAEQSMSGMHPAVWLAPFYVDVTDPIVSNHPEYFVHRSNGMLRTYYNYGPTYAALDVTSAGARDFVIAALQQYITAGERTLKIDFLFGGAVEGVRQEPITGLESYQRWMQLVRENTPGIHLIGCGAPLLPSAGWVDSMRTGPDIAYSSSTEPRYPMIAAEARHTALRSYSDHWFAADPDVVLLRGSKLSDSEAWTAIVADVMAGGNYLFGDGRQAGARAQLALDPRLLALTRDGHAARPLDVDANEDDRQFVSPLIDISGETRPPQLWKKRAADGSVWLAAFGWADDATLTIDIPASAIEISPNGMQSSPGALKSVSVSAHAARLFTWKE